MGYGVGMWGKLERLLRRGPCRAGAMHKRPQREKT